MSPDSKLIYKNNITLYFSDTKKEKLLTREEEIDITKRVKEGDAEARAILIKSNLRFVITIAKQYENTGLLLEDLISEGNVGLIMAADRFEPERGFYFISYAVYWIRQSILKAINEKSKIIRLPLNKTLDIMYIDKIIHKLYYKTGEKPSVEVIAAELNKTPSEISYIMLLNSEHISIENSNDTEDGSNKLADFLEDKKVKNVETEIIDKELKDELHRVMDGLTETERKIIEARYGLNQSKKTLKEVAHDYNLTQERIRQIEKKALRKMKTYRKNSLKDFL